jgi:hypothetical protein
MLSAASLDDQTQAVMLLYYKHEFKWQAETRSRKVYAAKCPQEIDHSALGDSFAHIRPGSGGKCPTK